MEAFVRCRIVFNAVPEFRDEKMAYEWLNDVL